MRKIITNTILLVVFALFFSLTAFAKPLDVEDLIEKYGQTSQQQEEAEEQPELSSSESKRNIFAVLRGSESNELAKMIVETLAKKEMLRNKFSTNKIYLTTYSYTDSEHKDSSGDIYGNSGAYSSLVSIYDDSRIETIPIGKKAAIKITVHSCACATGSIPPGSILYIKELHLYFRVDDNTDESNGRYQLRKAYDKYCSLWADIYVGKAAFEDTANCCILNYGSGVSTVTGKPNYPSPNSIYWKDGKNNFSSEIIKRITDFYNDYYSTSNFTFEIIRWGT